MALEQVAAQQLQVEAAAAPAAPTPSLLEELMPVLTALVAMGMMMGLAKTLRKG